MSWMMMVRSWRRRRRWESSSSSSASSSASVSTLVTLILLFCTFFSSTTLPTHAWNGVVHTTIGSVAQRLLTPASISMISTIALAANPNNTNAVLLSDISSWAETDARLAAYPWTVPLHFMYRPYMDCTTFNRTRDCPNDMCLDTGIRNYTAQLVDPSLSADDRYFALRVLVNLIADAHQPLHVGFQVDQGGELLIGRFINSNNNDSLHQIWDNRIYNRRTRQDFANNDTLYADYLYAQVQQQMNPVTNSAARLALDNCSIEVTQAALFNVCSATWTMEAARNVCTSVYRLSDNSVIQSGFVAPLEYYTRNLPMLEQMLIRAAYRTARVLNSIAVVWTPSIDPSSSSSSGVIDAGASLNSSSSLIPNPSSSGGGSSSDLLSSADGGVSSSANTIDATFSSSSLLASSSITNSPASSATTASLPLSSSSAPFTLSSSVVPLVSSSLGIIVASSSSTSPSSSTPPSSSSLPSLSPSSSPRASLVEQLGCVSPSQPLQGSAAVLFTLTVIDTSAGLLSRFGSTFFPRFLATLAAELRFSVNATQCVQVADRAGQLSSQVVDVRFYVVGDTTSDVQSIASTITSAVGDTASPLFNVSNTFILHGRVAGPFEQLPVVFGCVLSNGTFVATGTNESCPSNDTSPNPPPIIGEASSGSSLSSAAIAGIVIGGTVCVTVIALAMWSLVARYKAATHGAGAAGAAAGAGGGAGSEMPSPSGDRGTTRGGVNSGTSRQSSGKSSGQSGYTGQSSARSLPALLSKERYGVGPTGLGPAGPAGPTGSAGSAGSADTTAATTVTMPTMGSATPPVPSQVTRQAPSSRSPRHAASELEMSGSPV